MSSREIALKFCVAAVAAAALSRLGPIAALGGIVVSLVVESAVEHLVRRLRKRTLWSVGLLALFLERADRALAAIGLRGRRAAAAGATTAAATIAGALVIVGFTLRSSRSDTHLPPTEASRSSEDGTTTLSAGKS